MALTPVNGAKARSVGDSRGESLTIPIARLLYAKAKNQARRQEALCDDGKVKAKHSGKRHGMIKETSKFVRDARQPLILKPSDANIVINMCLTIAHTESPSGTFYVAPTYLTIRRSISRIIARMMNAA